MICVNCGSENTDSFFTELIPCGHCDEVNEINYSVCKECSLVWKSIGDQPVAGMMFSEPELGGMISDALDDFIGLAAETPGTMQEVVHHCLRCQTISYEIKPQLFHCPDCGFEWEVL